MEAVYDCCIHGHWDNVQADVAEFREADGSWRSSLLVPDFLVAKKITSIIAPVSLFRHIYVNLDNLGRRRLLRCLTKY
jgi:hypothetical protein